MVKTNKRINENAIEEIVKDYKIILCNQIKNGKCTLNEGMLYEPALDYQCCWKASMSETLSTEERRLCRINFILASMPKKEMEIIWKEFFFLEDKFWWMRKYNRSTYYRLRAKAINDFLSLAK